MLRDRSCPRSDESRRAIRSFLGDGLLAIEGTPHLRHRRMMAPAFHRERIRGYGELMCAETYADLANWRLDEKRDLREDMMRLTFTIVSRALFSADTRDEAHEVGKALEVILPWALLGATMAGLLPSLPVIYPPRGKAAIARLNRLVLDIVARRRAVGGDRGDLLSMLLATRDEDGTALSDDDICAEALTLLLSGHDTTANPLTWAWHLLTQNPDVQDRLLDVGFGYGDQSRAHRQHSRRRLPAVRLGRSHVHRQQLRADGGAHHPGSDGAALLDAAIPGHKVRQDPQIVLTTVGAFPVTLSARKGAATSPSSPTVQAAS